MEIKAASVDLWGTLIKSDPRFKPARNDMLRATFAEKTVLDDFTSALRSADQQADDIAVETRNDLDMVDRIIMTLEKLNISTIPSPDDPIWAEVSDKQDSLARAYHSIPFDQHVIKAVKNMATSMPICVTSNTGMLPGVLMRDLLALAGFDNCFASYTFSNEERTSKPSKAIFEATRRRLSEALGEDIHAKSIVHFGDNPIADGEGAENAGFLSLVVNADTSTNVGDCMDTITSLVLCAKKMRREM